MIDKFATFWSGTALPKTTQAYLVWDDDALYYAAKLTDAELRSFGTERNDSLWNGDVFELFFKPTRPSSPTTSSRPIPSRSSSRWPSPAAIPVSTPRRPRRWERRPLPWWTARSTSPATRTEAGPSRAGSPGRRSPHRRQAPPRRLLALRDLPLRLRPRRHPAGPDEQRPAHPAQFPPQRGLRQADVRGSEGVSRP